MEKRFGTLDILNKEIANMGNEIKRSCRIGKVKYKLQKDSTIPELMKHQPVIPGPFYNSPQPWWMQGPWCNQAASIGL